MGHSHLSTSLGYSCRRNSTSLGYSRRCEQVEEDLWCEESDDHPTKLEEKATAGTVTAGGYVEV